MALFTEKDIEYAQEVQRQYGVPASVTLAQYAQESGYGKYTVGKNNFFNIKGSGTGGYRDYDSKEESFLDFGKLLSSDRYTEKTAGATSAREYVEGVKAAGYAEDPQYVDHVMAIIEENNLTQYDTGTYSGGGGSASAGAGAGRLGLVWWGDIVKVVFCILIIAAGVLFLGVAVTKGEPDALIKKVKGGKKK